MTEAEWMTMSDPTSMREAFLNAASDRRARLYFVACCRSRICLFPQEVCRRALDCAEAFADGLASLEELQLRESQLRDERASTLSSEPGLLLNLQSLLWTVVPVHLSSVGEDGTRTFWEILDGPVRGYILGGVYHFAKSQGASDQVVAEAKEIERSVQSALLRDIFGNPFRPVAFDPSWRTSTVLSVAKQMYDSRDFGSMPILADALQDAGCENEEIVSHCRGGGPHVRGCWVVDLILGKE